MNFRKDFEDAAKTCGVDTLALHLDDMKTEGRYYYEESTEKAHSIAAELSLKAEAYIEILEDTLLDSIGSMLGGNLTRDSDMAKDILDALKQKAMK